MRTIVISALLLISMLLHLEGQKIIGYTPYYRVFPASFDFSLYTHINFFAVWPDSSGNLLWPGQNDSTSILQKYEAIQDQITDSQKLLITFGGTSEGGSRLFPHMADDPVTLERFSRNAVKLCKDWGADGIDIDWEWGKRLEESDSEIKAGYLNLMTRLHQLTREEGLLLSTAVSASSWFGDNYPVEGVDLADYINVMTYTYNGAWSSTANHHSPLSKSENTGMKYWKDKGIAASKLNLGVPFYAFKYEGPSTPGEEYRTVGTLAYPTVLVYLDLGYELLVDTINGSYCSNSSSIIFYDPPEDLSAKVRHVKEMDYHGIFIWELGQDDSDQTLSRAIYKSMYGHDPVSARTENHRQNFRMIYSPNYGIQISSLSGLPFSAAIYSVEGKLVNLSNQNYQETLISTGSLPSGIYILRIWNGEEVLSQKFSL